MNIKKKEGSFYASKVRLYLNEYNGVSLEDFCRAENVSYSKMCNSLGHPSYRKGSIPEVNPSPYVKRKNEHVLPSMELKPFVIDTCESIDANKCAQEVEKPTSDSECYYINNIRLRTSGQTEISISRCPVKVLASLIQKV